MTIKHKYNKETGFCWKLTWLNICCVDPHKLVSVRSALLMPPPQSMEYLVYHNAYRLTTPANRNVLWPTASTSNEWVTSAKRRLVTATSKKLTITILWECYVQHWLTLPEYSDIKPSLVALQMFTDIQLNLNSQPWFFPTLMDRRHLSHHYYQRMTYPLPVKNRT